LSVKTDRDFVDEETPLFFAATIWMSLPAGQPVVNEEPSTSPMAAAIVDCSKSSNSHAGCQRPAHRVLGVARDITAEHQAKNELRESEAKFHAIYEHTYNSRFPGAAGQGRIENKTQREGQFAHSPVSTCRHGRNDWQISPSVAANTAQCLGAHTVISKMLSLPRAKRDTWQTGGRRDAVNPEMSHHRRFRNFFRPFKNAEPFSVKSAINESISLINASLPQTIISPLIGSKGKMP